MLWQAPRLAALVVPPAESQVRPFATPPKCGELYLNRQIPWARFLLEGVVTAAALLLSVGCARDLDVRPDESCGDHSDEAVVTFSDTSLEAAVRATLQVGEADDLTCNLLSGVTELVAEQAEIESLAGIQNLTGLARLGLRGNLVTDIGPLSGLTELTELTLWENAVTDISPLRGMTSLTVLDLDDNAVTDLDALSGLVSLRNLYIDGSSITDLSPLSGLTNLTDLSLWNNSITDLRPLSGLTGLTRLILVDNSITEIGALSALTRLQTLYIDGNSIAEIGPLVGLTGLRELGLDNNPALADLEPLLDNTGIGAGDTVFLRGTGVSCATVATLESRGATVLSDCP